MTSISKPKYYVYIAIERKEAILDPSGKATEHALSSLGFGDVEQCRIGKLVRLAINADSSEKAVSVAAEAAAQLLSNPIMESFTILEVKLEPNLTETAEA